MKKILLVLLVSLITIFNQSSATRNVVCGLNKPEVCRDVTESLYGVIGGSVAYGSKVKFELVENGSGAVTIGGSCPATVDKNSFCINVNGTCTFDNRIAAGIESGINSSGKPIYTGTTITFVCDKSSTFQFVYPNPAIPNCETIQGNNNNILIKCIGGEEAPQQS